jgi:protoporphyrinogen oxidase
VRIAIIGAGVTGLVAAYRLGDAGHQCDVYERWPGLGGQAATLDVGHGHLVERYYHHLFMTDRHIADLYDELGLPDELEWHPSSVAVFTDGRSHPFTSPLDLLRFKPLSIPARLRMGIAILLLQRRHKSVEPFEDMRARDWIIRAMGREVYETLWGPMLRAKFGPRADDLSMAWLWSKLTLRRQIKGEQAKHELLGYPRSSFEVLYEALQGQIELQKGRVLIDRPAKQIHSTGGRFAVEYAAPDSFRLGLDPRRFETLGEETYDAVVVTVPSDIFEQLLAPDVAAQLTAGYLQQLHSIEYHTALCLLLELDRQFTPFYWTNVADARLPFLGLIEHTNLVDPARYDGRRFLYVANYRTHGDPLLHLGPDELLAHYEPGLRIVNPQYSRDWVKQRWLFKEPAAQPVVTVGYQRRLPALDTGVPGLILANTTQVYPEDRGTNYAVRLGTQAAREVADQLSTRSRAVSAESPFAR